MAASASTKQAKAADGASFPLAVLDLSGTGVGPYQPIHAAADSSGALIDLATAGKQDTANTALGAPADAAWTTGSGSIIALLKGIAGKFGAVVLAAGTAVIGKVGLQVASADVSLANPVPVNLPVDQDPIFDHANGTKNSVTVSAGVITPPAGCKYVRITSDVNVYVNTNNAAAVDDGTSILIIASQPETIPVVAGTQVRALSSSGTAVVRCMPLKNRP